MKSVLIKLIMQIDRSKFLDLGGVRENSIHYLKLEVAVFGDKGRETQVLRILIEKKKISYDACKLING